MLTVMVCICWAQGVELFRGVALLEWVWLCWSRCGLARVGVALLKEMCHCEHRLYPSCLEASLLLVAFR